jgi:hypothetical protein
MDDLLSVNVFEPPCYLQADDLDGVLVVQPVTGWVLEPSSKITTRHELDDDMKVFRTSDDRVCHDDIGLYMFGRE